MGLFSRSNQDNSEPEEILDKVVLPNREDINEELIDDSATGIAFEEIHQQPVVHSTGYSIEDAIKLMQALPQDNKEMVVTVVKKTLESTNINIKDIVAQADQKESRILRQKEKLEREIKQLETKISERKQRIEALIEDSKETTSVRKRLQLAVELDEKKTEKHTAKDEVKALNTFEEWEDTAAKSPSPERNVPRKKATFTSKPASHGATTYPKT